ncbi:MAG: hypothetical protein V2J55_13280 [Candidatus Competibacteraceae bacterium]|nr:hypothetical protein [Candidatus Competibacteraceae bacterium]
MPMELHKLGCKLFLETGTDIDLLEFIPVFHRWIQTKALKDLMIDVADYSHVYAGPGILLIAHEGDYGIDETGNQRGIAYHRKQPVDGDLPERLTQACAKTLQAARLLEQSPEFADRLRFRGDRLHVLANDRLNAPNTDETWTAFEPALKAFLSKLYPGVECTLERETDPKALFAVTIQASEPTGIDTLLDRLA